MSAPSLTEEPSSTWSNSWFSKTHLLDRCYFGPAPHDEGLGGT
jgi:hypothetical protein